MNTNNYPYERTGIGDWNGYLTHEYWRGIKLSTPSLTSFQRWLVRKLDLAIYVDYPGSPFPYADFTCPVGGSCMPPVGTRCMHAVCRSHASVCLIQAYVRKIQKWWRELPTEVAMPCAE